MDIDVDIQDARWTSLGLPDLVARATDSVCARLGIPTKDIELGLLAAGDAQIAALNGEFRDKPVPTNVLSWPAQELTPPNAPRPDFDGSLALGDIALAYETCAHEAQSQAKALQDHVLHLLVHGLLHLLGYDHQSDIDATLMEGLETEILGKLGVADPYI